MQRINNSIGEAIKRNREKASLTRAQLADALGIRYSTLSNYENDIREPDLNTLCLLADTFALTLDEFLSRQAGQSKLHDTISNQQIDELVASELRQAIAKIPKQQRKKTLLKIIKQCLCLPEDRLIYIEKLIQQLFFK